MTIVKADLGNFLTIKLISIDSTESFQMLKSARTLIDK